MEYKENPVACQIILCRVVEIFPADLMLFGGGNVGARHPQNRLQGNPVKIAKPISNGLQRFRKFLIRQWLTVPLVQGAALACKVKPFTRDPRAVISGFGIDCGSEIDRLAPVAFEIEADVKVGAAIAGLTAKAAEQEIALIWRNGGFKGINLRTIKEGPEVFRFIVGAVDQLCAKHIVMAALSRAGKINISTRGD